MVLKNVLLPAPFGPMMARNSPRLHRQVDAAERLQAAEALGAAPRPAGSARLHRRAFAQNPVRPSGISSTRTRMMMPIASGQYSVLPLIRTSSTTYTAAPSAGPRKVCTPPSTAITIGVALAVQLSQPGNTLPLESANSAAGEPGKGAGDDEGGELVRAHVDADVLHAPRIGAQRAQRVAEGRVDHAVEDVERGRRPARARSSSRRAASPARRAASGRSCRRRRR